MDADVTDYTKLWQIHGALVRLLSETSIAVVGADMFNQWIDPLDWTGADAGTEADKGRLKSVSQRIYDLGEDERHGLAVRSGNLAPAAWLGMAQTAWDECVSLQKAAGASAFRFSEVWGEVVVPTAVTVRDNAAEIKESAQESFWPLVVALVVIVVAVAVIKVA